MSILSYISVCLQVFWYFQVSDSVSSLVWSTSASHGKHLLSLTSEEFVHTLNEALVASHYLFTFCVTLWHLCDTMWHCDSYVTSMWYCDIYAILCDTATAMWHLCDTVWHCDSYVTAMWHCDIYVTRSQQFWHSVLLYSTCSRTIRTTMFSYLQSSHGMLTYCGSSLQVWCHLT